MFGNSASLTAEGAGLTSNSFTTSLLSQPASNITRFLGKRLLNCHFSPLTIMHIDISIQSRNCLCNCTQKNKIKTCPLSKWWKHARTHTTRRPLIAAVIHYLCEGEARLKHHILPLPTLTHTLHLHCILSRSEKSCFR